MKRNATIVKDINRMFPPFHKDYPVCFEVDGYVNVTSESFANRPFKVFGKMMDCEIKVVDYYGEESGGGYPWVDPKLQNYLDKNNLYYEWDNPGAIALFKN